MFLLRAQKKKKYTKKILFRLTLLGNFSFLKVRAISNQFSTSSTLLITLNGFWIQYGMNDNAFMKYP